jgi:uncharacterized protein (DUF58 family)
MGIKRLATVVAVSLGLLALAAGPSVARAATPSSLTLTASVVSQNCQGGDFVNVRLTATADSSSQVLGYRWDFTNDGRFDTRVLSSATINHRYLDEINVTAKVMAKNAEGNIASDTVSFATLRCE